MPFDIQTDRLTLRPPALADAAAMAALADDPAIARMTGAIPHPYRLTDAEAFITGVEQKKSLSWCVFGGAARETFIGVVGGGVAFGYWLGRPFWGQGLATEAARAAIDVVFVQTGAERLVAGVFLDNPASRRVLEKLDFAPSRPIALPSLARVAPAPAMEMILERATWRARRESA